MNLDRIIFRQRISIRIVVTDGLIYVLSTTINVRYTTMKKSTDNGKEGLLAFLAGVAVTSVAAYGVYKVFIEPRIREQQKTAQMLWTRIQTMELRIHELERNSSQNEEEHRMLKEQIEQLRQMVLTPEMRKKLEELLALLDVISQRRHQHIAKNNVSAFPPYVS
jgi:hypothetical protein